MTAIAILLYYTYLSNNASLYGFIYCYYINSLIRLLFVYKAL